MFGISFTDLSTRWLPGAKCNLHHTSLLAFNYDMNLMPQKVDTLKAYEIQNNINQLFAHSTFGYQWST